MAIKLKSGNTARWFGIVLSLAAAVIFTALQPEFTKKAAEYIEQSYYGGIEGEEFICSLIRSNYVFYKDVLDRSSDSIYGYEELYLTEKVDLAEDYLHEADYEMNLEEIQSVLNLYAHQVTHETEIIRSNYVDAIGTRMDYYVLNKETGSSLKNTVLPIEELLSPVEADDSHDYYSYYVIMEYDAAGNLQNISVRGKNADQLLKTVQVVENSKNARILPERAEKESFVFYDEIEGARKLLTVSQRKPANAVFVYAMTSKQIEYFQNNWSVMMENSYTPFGYAYYISGMGDAFHLILVGIGILVVLAAFVKPSLLKGKRERMLSMETVLAIAFVFLTVGASVVIGFLMVMDSQFSWIQGMFGTNEMEHQIIRNVASILFYTLIFGIWYWCCLELSDVFGGISYYFRTRSLTVRICRKIFGAFKKAYRNMKEEALGVDLGNGMNRLLYKILLINFCILSVICMMWGFGILVLVIYTFLLCIFLKKYIAKVRMHYSKLLAATNSIAQGKLNNTFEENFGVFESYKEELYKIQDGFRKAVDEEVKSQKMKTELITNVSHDLKTPLTAIITYIDLLKEEDVTETERKEYLSTLERKAQRLKTLIEDLFEMSKANSGNVNLELVPVDICSLMRQAYLEHEEAMEQTQLQVRFRMPEEKVVLKLDSQKTYRIFENLYANIAKYALPGTRVYVTADKREETEGIHIELKNVSAQEIVGNPQDLSERFVRGDVSRNTEGSGLGLAIAKSLTELQGGRFGIESDGDLFKVLLDW